MGESMATSRDEVPRPELLKNKRDRPHFKPIQAQLLLVGLVPLVFSYVYGGNCYMVSIFLSGAHTYLHSYQNPTTVMVHTYIVATKNLRSHLLESHVDVLHTSHSFPCNNEDGLSCRHGVKPPLTHSLM